MAKPTIAVLATLDTKGAEAAFVCDQLVALGAEALVLDIGVLGDVKDAGASTVSRADVARAGGRELSDLQADATREEAAPVMIAGATKLLGERLEAGNVHGVVGFGGLQGTAACTSIMRAMPYGLPKVMVSTVASGDVGSYVDVKDITMMYSVSDILGLNPFMRRVLANAAGAAVGMARAGETFDASSTSEKTTIGMTNLGVLTTGAMHAIELFEKAGHEVLVFHAVGSGGRAMEQMMREGLIGAVFDYAMGEIADALFGGLRAADERRLSVATELGLPQVIVPGGCEHLGILVDPPKSVPDRFKDHVSVFHNPVVFVPRLKPDEFVRVAEEIGRRLQGADARTTVLLPLDGTGSYAKPGGPLRDEEGDRAFFTALKGALPPAVEIIERAEHAEHPAFVEACVQTLLAKLQ